MNKPVYSIVVPLYNEEEVVQESYKRLKQVMEKADGPYEIIFINDGSKDATPQLVAQLVTADPTLRFISFSRNFGHQPAITAGMDYAGGDAIIIIDADLQDPPEVMLEMMQKWRQGYDVVYGKRMRRKGETFFKKLTSTLYYRVLRSMTNVDIPVDVGDFRLIDRKVCNALKSMPEKNRYMRGMVSWVGFNQTAVEYVRDERFAGETKYPLRKMIKLAVDGITAFSYKPLKFATSIGFVVSSLSFLYLLFILFQKIFTNQAVVGWASTVAILLFSQGIVMMILGVMGEYIGRVFEESKNRPIYLVKESMGFHHEPNEE